MTKKINIVKLAEFLELSPSTISRALKGNLRIKASTRDKIMSAATNMGYFQTGDENLTVNHRSVSEEEIITMRDLANELRISVSTVSRALSHPDKVSKETVAMVEHSAKTMGFSINKHARNLVSLANKRSADGPTIYTIADSLGLSAATVSRSFSAHASVSAINRDRVLKKAAEVGFCLNQDAAALKMAPENKSKIELAENKKCSERISNVRPESKRKTNKQKTLAIITSSLSDKIVTGMVSGIEQALNKRKVHVWVIKIDVAKSASNNLPLKLDELVDGIIYLPNVPSQKVVSHSHKLVPVITIGSRAEMPESRCIRIDQFESVYKATSTLLQSGCNHILLVDPTDSIDHFRRRLGFQKAHYENDKSPNAEQILRINHSPKRAKEVLNHIKRSSKSYDGLIFIDYIPDESDLRQLKFRGISPEQIWAIEIESIVDDFRSSAVFNKIYCSYVDLGTAAAHLMIDCANGKSSKMSLIEVSFITSPAASGAYLQFIMRSKL